MNIVLVDHSQPLLLEQLWLCRGRFVLTMPEKEMIQGEKLYDWVVNVAQQLLHKHFTHLRSGTTVILCQSEKPSKVTPSQWQLQIIHCKINHWIVASAIQY